MSESNSDVAVELITSTNAETWRDAWDQFVSQHAQATFFHRFVWFDILNSEGLKPYYLIASRRDTILGVLPLAHVKSYLFGNHLVSLPYAVYAGPLFQDQESLNHLMSAAVGLAEKLEAEDIEFRNTVAIEQRDLLQKDMYYTFRRAISADAEENLSAIPRKQRAMVRKGVNNNLSWELSDDLESFYQLFSESVHNLGTPVFSRRYFRTLTNQLGGEVEILNVIKDDRPVASVMSFYFRNEVMPYYAGSTPIARDLKANDYMYWALMQRAAQRGATSFDFGRSKNGTGPFSFKKNWGFDPTPLPYQYYLNTAQAMPERNPNNPRYHLLIEVWKRLPLQIANAVGPLVSKYLS